MKWVFNFYLLQSILHTSEHDDANFQEVDLPDATNASGVALGKFVVDVTWRIVCSFNLGILQTNPILTQRILTFTRLQGSHHSQTHPRNIFHQKLNSELLCSVCGVRRSCRRHYDKFPLKVKSQRLHCARFCCFTSNCHKSLSKIGALLYVKGFFYCLQREPRVAVIKQTKSLHGHVLRIG